MLLKVRNIPIRMIIPTEDLSWKVRRLPEVRRNRRRLKGFPPILVQERGNGTYSVRDGHHRLLLAQKRGNTYIRAWVLPVNSTKPVPMEPGDLREKDCDYWVMWRGHKFNYSYMWWGAWAVKLGLKEQPQPQLALEE